jgi:DNA-binding NarL/FixJ family response regulator
MPEQTAVIRLLLVEDSRDLTDVIALTVRHEKGIELVGVLHAADTMTDAVAEHEPDVVLIDLSMPGKPPLEAVREAARARPETRSIVYSGYDDPDVLREAEQAGAAGFVSKHKDFSEVLAVVRRVAAGETVFAGGF